MNELEERIEDLLLSDVHVALNQLQDFFAPEDFGLFVVNRSQQLVDPIFVELLVELLPGFFD